ncbi:hypothetical protein [Aureimonas endophytica]|nr:hypothetical protein [Aureimonas endophytica]
MTLVVFAILWPVLVALVTPSLFILGACLAWANPVRLDEERS